MWGAIIHYSSPYLVIYTESKISIAEILSNAFDKEIITWATFYYLIELGLIFYFTALQGNCSLSANWMGF